MPFAVTTGSDLLACFDAIESKREFARLELVERRLARLVATPAGFFRGAPGLFYALVARHRGARALLGRGGARSRWVVGDVHLENVGVIAIGPGPSLVFDFNDLDEAVLAPPVVDLLRGAASAVIAAQDLGFGARVALRAAEAFIVAYVRPLAEEFPRAVKALIARAHERTGEALLDERAPVQGGARRFALGKRYLPLDDEERAVAEALFDAYARTAPLPWVKKRMRLVDAAFRVQGTGSLGVRRFIFLARAGKKGDQFLIEAKEMRASALVRGGLIRSRGVPRAGQAARVAHGMEALLTEPQVGVRALRGRDTRSYLVRLHAPGEDKLGLASLQDADDLLALARMIGYRLSQAHERAGPGPVPAFDPAKVLGVALDLASAMTRAHLALAVRANLRSGA